MRFQKLKIRNKKKYVKNLRSTLIISLNTYISSDAINVNLQSCTVQCSVVLQVLQCSTVKCSTIQCITVQCSTVQCSTVQFRTVQWSTVQCITVQFSILQCIKSTVQQGGNFNKADRQVTLGINVLWLITTWAEYFYIYLSIFVQPRSFNIEVCE